LKKRTEITPDEIREAFKLPKGTQIAVSVHGRMPLLPFEKLTVSESVPVLVKTDPTYLVG
jgi:hypothetical protein